ncbi:MAG: histidinol-phosphatase HisJ family protein [Eubacterium sp.]|nr:histidinol-phosphatase HisJ family protein [Eubacterium sp.]
MNNTSIFADFHLHSAYSADCETDLRELISSCRELGLKMICLTDHNDFEFPDVPSHIRFDLDTENYLKELKSLREELKPDFDLRIGIEQGVMPSTCDKLNDFSKRYPGFDFIICSSHVVKEQDPYYPETFISPDGSRIDPKIIYNAYFEDILYNVQHFHDYNVYGHLDYVFRYGPRKINSEIFVNEYYDDIKDIVHEILKTIIEDGKGIEINTGSLYRGMDFMHPHELILKMYKELGGEILTFGSDAHDTVHPGYAFDKAREFALETGFKAFCTFKDMKPEFHDL